MKNDICENSLSAKWIYKIKHVVDGSIEKYKARFMARGFSQKEGEDYEDTFAPIVRYASIRFVIALASIATSKMHQMDVKTAFLNGVIEGEVYIEQPHGFEFHDRETHVCNLKALYGLKQAPRAWYGLKQAPRAWYSCFLTRFEVLIVQCKRELVSEFEMKELGLMHYYLGLKFWPKPNGIFVGQGKYIVTILQRFGMMDYKSMDTHMVTNLKNIRDSDSDCH